MFQARGAVSPLSPMACTEDAQLLWLPWVGAGSPRLAALSLPQPQLLAEVLDSPVRAQPCAACHPVSTAIGSSGTQLSNDRWEYGSGGIRHRRVPDRVRRGEALLTGIVLSSKSGKSTSGNDSVRGKGTGKRAFKRQTSRSGLKKQTRSICQCNFPISHGCSLPLPSCCILSHLQGKTSNALHLE